MGHVLCMELIRSQLRIIEQNHRMVIRSLSNLDRRVSWGTTSKALEKSRGVISFVHWWSYSIIGGQWVGQAGLVLAEAMLAVPNHLPAFHVPQQNFQEGLFHDLPRHRGEADRAVVPRVLLSTFLKMSAVFPVFQSPGTSHDFPISWRVA